jgi:DNA polymerase III, alpha subunit
LKSKGFKAVVTNDCHYVLEEQSKLQEIMLCVQTRDTIDNPNHWKFSQEDFFLKSREQMEQSLKECYPDNDFSEALDETVKISEMIDFEFPKAEPIRFPMKEEDKIEHFKNMCFSGLINRGFTLEDKLYKDRIDYEIDLIIKRISLITSLLFLI